MLAFDKDKIYRNFSSPKGLALIINNRNFAEDFDMPERLGTDVDAKNLNKLLVQLGYQVKIKENLTISDIRNAMTRFAKKKKHENCDSAVIVTLTHGAEGALYGTDNTLMSQTELVSYLNSVNCPQLLNKPKIFIIVASTGGTECGGTTRQVTVPFADDTFIAYAAAPGTMSFRNTKKGSWFVQGLREIFSRSAKNEEIVHLFMEVKNIVEDNFSAPGGHVQIPQHFSYLRKKFYFYPGIYIRDVPLSQNSLDKSIDKISYSND